MKRGYVLLALLCAFIVVFGAANVGKAFAQVGSELAAATSLGTVERLTSSDDLLHYRAILSDECYAVLGMKDASGILTVRFFDTPQAFEAAKAAAGIGSAQNPAGNMESSSSPDDSSMSAWSSTGVSPLHIGPGWHSIRAEMVIGSGSNPANDLQSMLTYYSGSGVSSGSWWANAIWWPNWTYNGSSSNSLYKAPNSSYYKYTCTQNFKATIGGTTYYNTIRNIIYGYSGGAWTVDFTGTQIDSRLVSTYWFYGYRNNNGWMH